jgi:hypothetical protein
MNAPKELILQEATHLPLMPISALVYYLHEKQSQIPYHKVVSIRSCLENIVETILVHIVEPGSEKKWRDANLNGRIDLLAHFFPADIIHRLHNIRKLGNHGAHQEHHQKLTGERISEGLSELSELCEWTILSYLKRHGIRSTNWLATVLSTLVPVYRVRILEQLIESNMLDKVRVIAYQKSCQAYNKKIEMGLIPFDSIPPAMTENENKIASFLLSIDKLAMAYLKNKEFQRSIEFVEDMHSQGWMTDENAVYTYEKLKNLQRNFHALPISESMEQTRVNLEKVLPMIKDDEQNLFLTLICAMVLEGPRAVEGVSGGEGQTLASPNTDKAQK